MIHRNYRNNLNVFIMKSRMRMITIQHMTKYLTTTMIITITRNIIITKIMIQQIVIIIINIMTIIIKYLINKTTRTLSVLLSMNRSNKSTSSSLESQLVSLSCIFVSDVMKSLQTIINCINIFALTKRFRRSLFRL